ncbi:hypothetical protein [Krasilnikovia sp. M28-CT-15]|uniref:hypothetical protein n=1 Tax=Krasilnikovia sp. M28-CT-15 TaxID=3373540 RepID=UPI00399C8BB7
MIASGQPVPPTVAPTARRRAWLVWLLAGLAVLSCCGGLNGWVLQRHTRPNATGVSGMAVTDLVEGREYPIYADAPGADELHCTIGSDQFQRDLTVRRSADAPMFAATASVDGSPKLPFFGRLRSDRSEFTGVTCGPDQRFVLAEGRGPLSVLLGGVGAALLLAVAALVAVLVGRRRRSAAAPAARPSAWWLLAAPAMLLVGVVVLATAVVAFGAATAGTDDAPRVGSDRVYGNVSVLTERGGRYLVYQAGDGPAQDCVPVHPGGRPWWAPETVDFVGTTFRYVGSFRGAGERDVHVDCAGAAPLMVRVDRGPLAVVSLSASAFLLLGVAAFTLVVTILVRRRRKPAQASA